MIGLGARCVAAVGADVRQLRFVQMQRPEAATADGVEQRLEPRFGPHTIPGPIHRQQALPNRRGGAHGRNVAHPRGEVRTGGYVASFFSQSEKIGPAAAFLHSRRLADAILDCEAALLGWTNVVHLRNLRIVYDYVDPASPRERAGGPVRTK